MQRVRIFISSPGDVSEERERARQVIQGLRRRYAQHFDLVPVLWEDMPLSLGASFQEGIDVVLSVDRGVDIAVFILWSRLGSALGPLVRREDGRDYRSGTERELDLMLRARDANGGDRPHILAYARLDEATFEESLRGKTTAEKEELLRQKRLVEQFIQETFHDPTTGTNVRAYHTFHRPQTFGERLRVHLQEILDGMCEGRTAAPLWDIDAHGPPFRGLEPFRFEHAEIFFGREDEVLEARTRLAEAARRGTAFLLIGGASGTGKSSLAAAGLLPELVDHEIDDAVARWIHVHCTPAAMAGDPAGGIARLLGAAIPSLADGGDAADFALALSRDPELAVKLVLLPALRKLSRPGEGAVRVVVLVDQLEELFTDARLTDAARASFAGILHALASSGQAWIVATIRGDFYPRLLACDPLVRLKSAGAQLDLLPPHADAIRRMIESPAALAGLRFEDVGNASVADRILRDIAAQAELLPLLEDFLRELFERRSPAGVLTLEAYEALGGIVGSLANRAEAAFTSLPADAQLALPDVLRQLVSMDELADGVAVRRRAPLAAFPGRSPARHLVDRLVADRLATADSDDTGRPEVMIAHEAILRVWPRAAAWIAQNGEFLRTRDRLTARMTEGAPIASDDPLLAAAQLHLAAQPDAFDEGLRDYLRQQIARVEAKRVRRERRRRAVVAGLAALTLCSMAAAGVAAWQWRQARVARDLANESRLQAEGLVDTIVFQLWARLEEAGRLDLLADSHGAITAYYGDRIAQGHRGLSPASKEETERTVSRIVKILRTKSDLEQKAGDVDAAEKSIRMGISLVRAVRKLYPGDATMQLHESHLNTRLADLATFKRDPVAARTILEADLESLEELLKDTEAEDIRVTTIQRLSIAHERLGNLFWTANELENAREHYEESLRQSIEVASYAPEDGETQQGLAFAHGHVGDVAAQMGDLVNAREHYEKAHRIAEAVARLDRRNVKWQESVATQAGRLANLAFRAGDADAERTYREQAITVLKPLADADATDTLWHGEVLDHAQRVASIALAQKDLTSARRFQEVALAAASTLARRQPDNVAWKEAVASAHDSLGEAAQSAGDLDAAKEEFAAALELYRHLAGDDAGTPWRQLALGIATSRLGHVMETRGDLEGATACFKDALALYEALPLDTRETPDCMDAVSVAHSHLGDLAAAAGDMASATFHRKQDLAFVERLASLDPTYPRWQRLLGLSVARMGDLELDADNVDVAAGHYQRALAIAVALTKNDPDDVIVLADSASAHEKLASLAARQNDAESALRHLEGAVVAREAIVRARPFASDSALAWCATLLSLGDQFDAAGDAPAARECADRAHAVIEQYATRDPADAGWQGELAASHQRLAWRESSEGRLTAARARIARCVAILKSVSDREPDNIVLVRQVADAQRASALFAVLAMDVAATRGHLESAIGGYRVVVEQSPGDAECRSSLAEAYGLLGSTHALESDNAAARDHFSSGLRVLETMIAEDPGNVSLRCLEADAHMNLGNVDASEARNSDAMARYQRAMEILEPLAQDHPDEHAVNLQLAKIEACKASVLNEDGDRDAAQRSADRAVDLLAGVLNAVRDSLDVSLRLAAREAHTVRGDVLVGRGDCQAALRDYADALAPLAPFLQDGRTYPLFAWLAVEVDAGLQWLAERQGDAFAAGQHGSDLKLMVRRAMAEAPQAAAMCLKKLDEARGGVLVRSRVTIAEEVGRKLRESGNAEAAATCDDYAARWRKLAEDAATSADTPVEAAAAAP